MSERAPAIVISSGDAERLRGAGLRVTGPRLAALAALPIGRHLAVEEVATAVRDRVGAVSLQAVYNLLDALDAAGLVRRVEPIGHPARYESRVADNHHHLVCRSCGDITDVDCAVGHAPCLSPATDAGYLVDEADVTYWGHCPRCRAVSAGPTTSDLA
jgi:Fur family ferric uptake transcriptional regulator